MIRVAYIELDTHAEIASSFMKLAKKVADLQIDYYFSQKILSRLGIPDSENVYLAHAQTVADLVSNKSYDLVVIGTAHHYFNTFYNISKRNKTALIVHNVNFSKAGRFRLLLNCFKSEQLYRLKLLLKEGLFLVPSLYRNCQKLVLDEDLVGDDTQFLPLFSTENWRKISHDKLTVVVPGTVSEKRRNYTHVLNKMQFFQNPVRLVLLGKAADKELAMIRSFIKKNENVEVIYFQQKISSEEFDFWLRSADVLWCPLKLENYFFGIREIYGKTKMSGNLGDAIRSQNIAVFTKKYASHYNFIKIEKDDIESQLFSLKGVRKDNLFLNFEPNIVRERFEKMLKALILCKK